MITTRKISQVEGSYSVTAAKISFTPVSIKEAGYMYIYLSYENESNNGACPALCGVYFDDMKVTHTRSNVIQYNEYYPFGLLMGNSWTRESNTGNNYLYNEGNELNATSGFYEMYYRGYDPALGRMLQPDPYASAFATLSPYNYAGNNPVLVNDPSGGIMRVNPESGGGYEFSAPYRRISYQGSENWSIDENFIMMRDWLTMGGGGFSDKYGVDSYTLELQNGLLGYWVDNYTDWTVQGKDVGSQYNYSYWMPFSASEQTQACPKCVTYPDGSKGPDPAINGIIYEPTVSTNGLLYPDGYKMYYNEDYKKLLWNPVNPNTLASLKAAKMKSPEKLVGFKEGYSLGYKDTIGSQGTYLIITLAAFASGIDADEKDDYLFGWSRGWAAGRNDAVNYYSNILSPTPKD